MVNTSVELSSYRDQHFKVCIQLNNYLENNRIFNERIDYYLIICIYYYVPKMV